MDQSNAVQLMRERAAGWAVNLKMTPSPWRQELCPDGPSGTWDSGNARTVIRKYASGSYSIIYIVWGQHEQREHLCHIRTL